jgi:hypothetical protein
MGFADLHIHTTYSWDGTATVRGVLKQAALRNLDVIAITDHDQIAGALEAIPIAADYGLEVIPASEITTSEGDLLALFIQRVIPPGLTFIETLLQVGEQGGVAIAAHPKAAPGTRPQLLGRFMNCVSHENLQAAHLHPQAGRILVGIETFNGSLAYLHSNQHAAILARRLGLAAVANSDAHMAWAIGSGASWFPGTTAQDLRQALFERSTHPAPRLQSSQTPIKLLQSWLPRYLMRRAGWVTTNVSPNRPLRMAPQVNQAA